MREYKKNCPGCNRELFYERPHKLRLAIKNNSKCTSCANKGRVYSDKTKKRISDSVKLAMKKPEVRKKLYGSLSETRYLKSKLDRGQLELLKKWNKLGFNFEPNYQLHNDEILYYIDGYDRERNIVLEYDSKYHQKIEQKQKDLIRQQKIIDILKPKRFWRYDSVTQQIKDVLEK